MYANGTSMAGVLCPLLLLTLSCGALAFTAVPTLAAGVQACPDEQIRQERDSTALPDCRAYEMVTPPQKNGAEVGAAFLAPTFQIASNGQQVIANSLQCFAGSESCVPERQSMGEPFKFTRTSAGWVTHPLAPPGSFEADSWWNISADVGTALYSIPSPPEGQDAFYARQPDGTFAAVGPFAEAHREATYRELPTQEDVVATADLSHVVYEPQRSLWSFDHTGEGIVFGTPALYEYVGAGNALPLMVGVNGGPESHELISRCGTVLGDPTGGIQRHYGSLSADGRTVYFTAMQGPEIVGCPPVDELYARIDGGISDAHAMLISGPTPATCTSEECKGNTSKEKESERARNANFEGASTDGSKVFFTDTQQLTDGASEDENPGSTAVGGCREEESGGCNLYESECPNGDHCAQPSERRLIDVSEGLGGAPVPGGPRVQGLVAMSADGSHVYFVAKGALTGEEENANHEKAINEEDNLYMYGDGHLAFVATLSALDEAEWEVGTQLALSANVTPDGQFLVFTSHRALTPDDTRNEGPVQVFEYDAQTKSLIRISIGENGFNHDGNEGAGDAGIVHAGRPIETASVPVRSDPTMSDDGAFVFFHSPVALTAGALNDVQTSESSELTEEERLAQNIYEYHAGHVYLISDGKDTTPQGDSLVVPVELAGSDASGANVFFATFDPLTQEDTDGERNYYDAHICSEEEPCPPPKPAPPAPCEGEACHGVPPGQSTGQTPGSESFIGPGNLISPAPAPPKPKTATQIRAEKLAKALKACHAKHNKHKRATCEKQARKRFGSAKKAAKAKGAGSNRRVK